MASGGSDSQKARVDCDCECEQDNVICPICLDIFEHPRMAPTCGHSFCSKCMANWIQHAAFVCPVCRSTSQVPSGSISKLPINRDLQKTADFYRQKQSKGQTVFCATHPWHTDSLLFCEDCNVLSCAECVEKHPRHLLVSVDSAKEQFRKWYSDRTLYIRNSLQTLGQHEVTAAISEATRSIDRRIDLLIDRLQQLRVALKVKSEKVLLQASGIDESRAGRLAAAESMMPKMVGIMQRSSLVEMINERDKVAALCDLIVAELERNMRFVADLPDEGFKLLDDAICEVLSADDLWRVFAKPVVAAELLPAKNLTCRQN